VFWYLNFPGLTGGGKIVDLVAGNNGTLVNCSLSDGPIWTGAVDRTIGDTSVPVAARPGGFAAFQSYQSASRRIDITGGFGLGATNASFAVWAMVSSSVNNRGPFIKIGSTTTGYGIGIGSATWDTATGTADTEIIALLEAVRWIDTNVFFGAGWHHLTFTIDNAGLPRIYKDGVLLASYSGTGAVAPATTTYIGGYPAVTRYCSALIDDVTAWSRCLNDGQVWLNYQASRAGYPNELNWMQLGRWAQQTVAAFIAPRPYLMNQAVKTAAHY
jgi:hypothetical protein